MKEKIFNWQTAFFCIVVIKNIITAVGAFFCLHHEHRFLGCLLSCIVFVELCVALIMYTAYIKEKDEENEELNYIGDI